MVTFEKVVLKNFLSFGEDPVEVLLNTDKITAIKGNNGAGKSTILDAIYFGLYGKSFRGTVLKNIINSKNKKNCLVELYFNISGKEYIIRRGLGPNLFEIYIDGNLKDISDVKTYQKNFISDILKIDEKTFRQLVVVGSSSYVPFLELSTGDRRIVVEQILRLDIFSKMNNIVNEKLSICSDKLLKAEHNKDTAVEKYNLATKMLSEDINEYKKQCLNLTEQNKNLKSEYEKLPEVDDEIKKIRESQSDLSNKIKDIEENKTKKSVELSTIKKHISYFDKNKKCPLCHQETSEEFLDDKKKKQHTLEVDIKKYEDDIYNFKKQHEEFDKNLSNFLSIIENKNNIIRQIDNNKKLIKKYVDIVKNKKEENNLEELKNDIDKFTKEYNNIDKIDKSLLYIKSILKDDGVKKVIIDKYLEKLNENINKYLEIINMPLQFSMNNKFEEKIINYTGKEYTLDNFSSGERLRINISIMFALRDFAKIYNSISTNLIFLDEFEQGVLDEGGISSMIDIILSLDKQNIFIISHNTENFDNIAGKTLNIKKENGISYVE